MGAQKLFLFSSSNSARPLLARRELATAATPPTREPPREPDLAPIRSKKERAYLWTCTAMMVSTSAAGCGSRSDGDNFRPSRCSGEDWAMGDRRFCGAPCRCPSRLRNGSTASSGTARHFSPAPICPQHNLTRSVDRLYRHVIHQDHAQPIRESSSVLSLSSGQPSELT